MNESIMGGGGRGEGDDGLGLEQVPGRCPPPLPGKRPSSTATANYETNHKKRPNSRILVFSKQLIFVMGGRM